MTPVILSFACGVLFLQLQPELPGVGCVRARRLALPPFSSAAGSSALPAAFALGFCWALGMAQLSLPTASRRSSRAGTSRWSAWSPACRRRASAACASNSSPSQRRRRRCRAGSCCPGTAAPADEDQAGPRRDAGASGRALALHACACAGRTATSIRTASTTRPGCLKGVSERPGTSDPARRLCSWESQKFTDRIESKSFAKRCATASSAVLGETPASGILAALAVGDQRSISAEEWRLFNRTGVTHLMSISGAATTARRAPRPRRRRRTLKRAQLRPQLSSSWPTQYSAACALCHLDGSTGQGPETPVVTVRPPRRNPRLRARWRGCNSQRSPSNSGGVLMHSRRLGTLSALRSPA